MLRYYFILNLDEDLYSATIIDKHWLVTSSNCCSGMDNYELIFDSKEKNQWIWKNRKQLTTQSWRLRSDDDFFQEKYEDFTKLYALNNLFP